jgi:hypothetical protein
MCIRAGGLIVVPFGLKGRLKERRTLKLIEETTGTSICMKITGERCMIVVLVCPGKTGNVENVRLAVQQIKDLRAVPQHHQWYQRHRLELNLAREAKIRGGRWDKERRVKLMMGRSD